MPYVVATLSTFYSDLVFFQLYKLFTFNSLVIRKILTLAFFLAFTLALTAQAPQSFQYQTIIRDAQGDVVANQNVSLRMTIFQGPLPGTNVYQETHTLSTNAFGLVNLEIGDGTPVSGDFTTIDWGTGDYHVQVELDLAGGINYTIMGTTQLQSVPYALYAETAGSGGGTTYQVGDFAQGGVVFYVDASGKHGLVADIVDISTGINWSSNSNTVTGATGGNIPDDTGGGVGAGKMNTALIVKDNPSGTSAAKLCADLNKGGYGDWYLPSKGELYLMYANRMAINTTAVNNGGSAFTTGLYWSSSEFTFNDAWYQVFDLGDQFSFSKSGSIFRVRAGPGFLGRVES
jgi:hypothetical protein